jgi:hypothetical protein
MWTLAGIYDELYRSEGKKAGSGLAQLQRVYEDMKARPAKYKKPTLRTGGAATRLPYRSCTTL